MSGLPYTCAMLCRAETRANPDSLLPVPILKIIVAIGKQRWVFQCTRSADTPAEISDVIGNLMAGKLKNVTSFFTL